jgi:hypothetical protein
MMIVSPAFTPSSLQSDGRRHTQRDCASLRLVAGDDEHGGLFALAYDRNGRHEDDTFVLLRFDLDFDGRADRQRRRNS